MPFIPHLFKKDLRRSHLLIGFWIVLVLAQYAIMASPLTPGEHFAPMIYNAIAGPLQVLVLAVIVALLVQEEPPAGTTGFWLARPIPRSAVLATKMLFAVVLISIPVLAEIIVFAAAGVTAHDTSRAVLEVVFGELQIMLFAGILAALTPSFARFAVAGIIGWVGVYLVSMAINWLPSRFAGASFQPTTMSTTLIHSRTIVGGVIVVIGLGLAFIYQYLTRRTARVFAAAVAVELAALVAGSLWKWDLFPRPSTPAATVALDREGIHLRLLRTEVQDQVGFRGAGPPRKNVVGKLLLEGLPEGYAVLPMRVDPRVNLPPPDGRPVPVESPRGANTLYTPSEAVIERAMGPVFIYGQPFLWQQQQQGVPSPLALFDAESFRRYSGQKLVYAAELQFGLERYVVSARLPLKKGSYARQGSESEMITDVLREGDRVNILLHRRYLNLLLERPADPNASGKFLTYLEFTPESRTYLLYNSKRGEALRYLPSNSLRISDPLGSARLTQDNWQFSFGPTPYALTPDLTEAWMAGAELVELRMEPAAEFGQSLTVPNLVLGSPNLSPIPAPVAPPANPRWLTRFKLSRHASKTEMKEYAYDLVAASEYWHSDIWNELPVAMLAKVGPGNADVLIGTLDRVEATSRQANILRLATLRSAGPPDRQPVLKALAANPTLVSLVVKYHWQADCRDTLVAKLRDKEKDNLPRDWIVATAALRDPSTYPDLKAYLLRARNRQATYNAIRKLPGIDLGPVVAEAWNKAKHGPRPAKVDAAAMAVDMGYPDALGTLVDVLRQDDVSQPRQIERALNLVRRYTPATGDSAELVAWYDSNKGRLFFDSSLRKYFPQAAGTPTMGN